MSETRKQLKERLKATGKWPEYVSLREGLVAEGLTPAQAREEALRRVEVQPAASGPTCQSETPEKPALTAQPLPDFSRRIPNNEAVQWVAEHLADPNVSPEDAPSSAWALLQWVRLTPANQTTFWGTIWPKLLPTGATKQKPAENEPEPVDEGTDRCEALIDRLLKDFHEEQAREDAELAARPDAAKIGSTLQNRLNGALQREAVLKEEAAALRAKVKELENANRFSS